MIEPHGKLSQTRQCQLLDLACSTYYYQPQPISNADLVLLRMMDEQYLKTPQYGSRSYATWFQRQGIMLGRKKASSLQTLGTPLNTCPLDFPDLNPIEHKWTQAKALCKQPSQTVEMLFKSYIFCSLLTG